MRSDHVEVFNQTVHIYIHTQTLRMQTLENTETYTVYTQLARSTPSATGRL